MFDRSAIIADYDRKWRDMRVMRPGAVEAAAKRILAHIDAYRAIEAETGVPWFFVGILHMRECNNDMGGVLHNGEKIIGTGRKTRLAPKGRGPFSLWHEAALDALAIKGYSSIKKWTPGVCCYEAERFNGFGYRMRGVPSPYVLGATQFYKRGKFIHDGPSGWRANFVDPQLGIAPVMKRCIELGGKAKRPNIFKRMTKSRAETKEIVRDDRRLTWADRYNSFCEYLGVTWAAIVAFVQSARDWLTDTRTIVVFSILALAYVASRFFKWQQVTAKKRKFVIPAADGPKVKTKPKTRKAA